MKRDRENLQTTTRAATAAMQSYQFFKSNIFFGDLAPFQKRYKAASASHAWAHKHIGQHTQSARPRTNKNRTAAAWACVNMWMCVRAQGKANDFAVLFWMERITYSRSSEMRSWKASFSMVWISLSVNCLQAKNKTNIIVVRKSKIKTKNWKTVKQWTNGCRPISAQIALFCSYVYAFSTWHQYIRIYSHLSKLCDKCNNFIVV